MFADRTEAGRLLAGRLEHLKDTRPIVLGLPRGGVPVAFEVARALHAPLDVSLVRKIGAPDQPELAVGAVVDGGSPQLVINPDVIALVSLPDGFLEREQQRQLVEIERRRILYRGDRAAPDLRGRTVIIVDDGIATGATAHAAVQAAVRAGAARVVLAVPVLPGSAVAEWMEAVDELVFIAAPEPFGAVGYFYADFSSTTDEEVADLLRRASEMHGADTGGGKDDLVTQQRRAGT